MKSSNERAKSRSSAAPGSRPRVRMLAPAAMDVVVSKRDRRGLVQELSRKIRRLQADLERQGHRSRPSKVSSRRPPVRRRPRSM